MTADPARVALRGVLHGTCGEEFWIAEEVWRLSRTLSRPAFVRFVALLLHVGQKKNRRLKGQP